MLKTIFEKYKIDNKIFAIGFDNASNNTIVIPYLINLCNTYFEIFHYLCGIENLILCYQGGDL